MRSNSAAGAWARRFQHWRDGWASAVHVQSLLGVPPIRPTVAGPGQCTAKVGRHGRLGASRSPAQAGSDPLPPSPQFPFGDIVANPQPHFVSSWSQRPSGSPAILHVSLLSSTRNETRSGRLPFSSRRVSAFWLAVCPSVRLPPRCAALPLPLPLPPSCRLSVPFLLRQKTVPVEYLDLPCLVSSLVPPSSFNLN